jgi:hypothetical protein
MREEEPVLKVLLPNGCTLIAKELKSDPNHPGIGIYVMSKDDVNNGCDNIITAVEYAAACVPGIYVVAYQQGYKAPVYADAYLHD